jgi:CubicO group peptidase (beta-lactamase class C family)
MIIRRVCAVMALSLLLLSIAARGHAATGIGFSPGPALPFRFAELADEIVADLERFIPRYMSQKHIPGTSVALIRDGKVIWTEGFGVTNTITRSRVTPETLFEAASNSKVVTAYIALRLVDQGLLSLDEPLNSYLSEPWLPPSSYRDTITLRHVLSHTSGLGHLTKSRESRFAPGEGYFYSGIGYAYLQAVLEEVTGRPLDDLAQELVFAPLGMPHSSFTSSRPGIAPRTANGHLHALAPTLLFLLPLLLALFLIAAVALPVNRLLAGNWRPGRRLTYVILTFAFLLSLVPALLFFVESGMPAFSWLVVLWALFMAAALALAALAGRALISRLLPGRRVLGALLTVCWCLLALAGLLYLASRTPNLPAPKWPPPQPDAGGSLRATAGDLASFLIELSDPRYLSPETAAQMQASQVELAPDLSWGLGPGIQHSGQGDALWQWGQHLHFQSVMIIYPEQGFGVVVCTNNDLTSPEVAVEIAHRALGGKIEPIMRQATGLAYNYRPEE